MAGKALPNDIVERVIADWRTGEYSQRQLATKHNISNGMVAKLTKGLERDCEQIVSNGVNYRLGIAKLDKRTASAVSEVVDYKVRVSGLASVFVEKSIKKATAMLDSVEDAQSLKHLSDAVDRNTITAGINERHAKPAQIQNNQQNNYSGMDIKDLEREISQIESRRFVPAG